ncbi:MAG: ribonuclease E inhibitor RraB [Leucothrix sp.]
MSKKHLLTVFLLLAIAVASPYAAADENTGAEQTLKRKPDIAKREGISASLDALRRNGALDRATRQVTNQNQIGARTALANQGDANTVIAIKHVLTCETEANCQVAFEWADASNFNTTGVLTSEGHGGETMYHLFLRQEVAPNENTIADESDRVHQGIANLEGIGYSTWMLDMDPSGANDTAGISQ